MARFKCDAQQISVKHRPHKDHSSPYHSQDHAGRFSFPSSTPLDGPSTPLAVSGARFGLLAIIARSASKLSSSNPIAPPSHFSSSRLGSGRSPPRSMRSGDSTIGGRRARDSFRVGGVLLKFDREDDEESPEVRESNLVTNVASARRSSSSCCRAYNNAQHRHYLSTRAFREEIFFLE